MQYSIIVYMQIPKLSEIKKRRKELGLTQTELAKQSGVSQSLIARVEKGTVDPCYSKVDKIFLALDRVRGREIMAKDIMTRSVVGIQVGNTMEKAASKMKKHGVSQMPVFDGDAVVGSVSEKVILEQIGRGVDGKTLSTESVENYMEYAFPTVSLKTPLSAVSVLLEHNTAVMVVEKGKTKGIITNADLLKVVHG